MTIDICIAFLFIKSFHRYLISSTQKFCEVYMASIIAFNFIFQVKKIENQMK